MQTGVSPAPRSESPSVTHIEQLIDVDEDGSALESYTLLMDSECKSAAVGCERNQLLVKARGAERDADLKPKALASDFG